MQVDKIQLTIDSLFAFRQGERNVDTGGVSSDTVISTVNKSNSPEAQAQTSVTHINYIKKELDTILIDYPPFFPAGSPQRIDLIKKIKGLQGEIENAPVSSDTKKSIRDQKLSDKATDAEINTALQGIMNAKNELTRHIPAESNTARPGSFLDVKI